MDALRLVIVLALIVLALQRKLSVGITLVGAGLVTALLYWVPPLALWRGYADLLQSSRFISLTAVIVLITTLGRLLQELGALEHLTASVRDLPGGNRTAAGLLPPLVGLMPMPGGSLLSAPLVGNVLSADRYRPEFRTVTNYWFRHIVEFSWPIYPGLILTEAITGMKVGNVALLQLPLALAMAAIGAACYLRKIESEGRSGASIGRSLRGIGAAVWPIPLAIALYGIFKLNLALSVLAAMLILVAAARPNRAQLLAAVRHGFSWKLIILVFGALSFQTVLELAGAVEAIPHLVERFNLPPEPIIFLVPFVSGLLTGMVAPTIAMSYPILAVYLYVPGIAPAYILLAYLATFLGIMLSPTHLCLILTNEFFGSDLAAVYRRIALPVVLVALSGVLLYLSPWPALFR